MQYALIAYDLQLILALMAAGGGGADAGFAAHATLRLLTAQHYAYVLARPRTRKFTDGKYLRDLGQHLP